MATSNTQWCVITGPPCSGKTTLITKLQALGYPVIHEVARSLIEASLKQGLTADQIRADKAALQYEILKTKIDIEDKLAKDQLIFLDRGIPDSMPYFKLAGLDPKAVVSLTRCNHYKLIFFLEPLKYQKDLIRTEEIDTATRIAQELVHSYTMLGYEPIHIPDMFPEERLARVLDAIRRH